MVWWIEVSRPARLGEWIERAWPLRASKAQAEKLADEINAAPNEWRAETYSRVGLTTIARFGDKETAALGWVPDWHREWWLTVSRNYGAGESAETTYRISADREVVEALAARINDQHGECTATAHDVPNAVALADVIGWEDGALGNPLDPQKLMEELKAEELKTTSAEMAR